MKRIIVLLIAFVLAGCGYTSDYSSADERPFEVFHDGRVVATCDRIKTHTDAMVECMDENWETVGFFSTEQVNVIREGAQ